MLLVFIRFSNHIFAYISAIVYATLYTVDLRTKMAYYAVLEYRYHLFLSAATTKKGKYRDFEVSTFAPVSVSCTATGSHLIRDCNASKGLQSCTNFIYMILLLYKWKLLKV